MITRLYQKTGSKVYRLTDKFLPAQLLLVLLIAHGLLISSFAQPGSLDHTFGTNGKVVVTLGSFGDRGNTIAIQNDGKIVLGGSTQSSFTSSDFALTRFNGDGTLDTSFGLDGKVITPIENRSAAHTVVIQDDGKILLGGYSKWNINLARYHSDGTLDTSFGSGGTLIIDIEGYYSDQCESVVLQEDGKISKNLCAAASRRRRRRRRT